MSKSINRIISAHDDGIIKPVELYLEAIRSGDTTLLITCFRDTANIYGLGDGAMQEGSINIAVDYFKARKPPTNVVAHLSVIGRTPTTAVVKCEFDTETPASQNTNFFSLIKVDEKWEIVSEVFHVYT
ncbi:hypothetical protein N7462_001166 [Penicillium macrosclerotiorum]|uniref:uncharacterized protein n=1 Tax=Penicillium macrosclerotiorum TaxID=303699 RepID=UPI0025478360|nr:uncharacterized protein N7462_001166 [Penicillium macrosclerotiorum]KAJ5691743.1 hypothetical protein N7462_001166 [Penicillium macrosclerotiorum]